MEYIAAAFLTLWDTTEEVFLRCGIQKKNNRRTFDTFFSVVYHNAGVVSHTAKEFSLFYPTTQKVLYYFWIQWRKMIHRRIIFLNFKCLSLPSDKTLGKIGFVNIQIKPWREVKMLNYIVGFMKKLVGYNPEEICHILKPK